MLEPEYRSPCEHKRYGEEEVKSQRLLKAAYKNAKASPLKVYIVVEKNEAPFQTGGHNCAVWSTKEKAQKYIDTVGVGDLLKIEEWEVDKNEILE